MKLQWQAKRNRLGKGWGKNAAGTAGSKTPVAADWGQPGAAPIFQRGYTASLRIVLFFGFRQELNLTATCRRLSSL
jgi:hypothetical protein